MLVRFYLAHTHGDYHRYTTFEWCMCFELNAIDVNVIECELFHLYVKLLV